MDEGARRRPPCARSLSARYSAAAVLCAFPSSIIRWRVSAASSARTVFTSSAVPISSTAVATMDVSFMGGKDTPRVDCSYMKQAAFRACVGIVCAAVMFAAGRSVLAQEEGTPGRSPSDPAGRTPSRLEADVLALENYRPGYQFWRQIFTI